MNAIEARRLAENCFRHADHPLDRQPPYEAEAVTVRAKTARLKALRLASKRSGIAADRRRNMGTLRRAADYPCPRISNVTLNATNIEEGIMDKDRIKGSAEQAKGAVKEAAGKVLGDKKLETEGKTDKAAGKVQNAVGGVKDAVRGK